MKRIFGVSFLSAFSFLCFQILEEPIFLVLGIGLLVYSIIKCRFLNRRIILFLFIFLPILISFRTYFKIQQVKQIEKYIEHHEHMTFCGVISNIEIRKSGYRILLDKVSSDGHRLGKAYLYKSKCTYCVGDRILSKGKISLPKIAKNDGGYDERDNLYGIGVHFKSYDPKISIEHRPIFSLNRALYRFRVRISENLHKNFPKEEGDLVSAMCVGDKSDTANDAKELFRLAGIISLLAVSGTHISVVSKRLYNLLRKERFSYLSCLIISGIISICYGRICGNSISTIRACFMFIVLCIAEYLGYSYDSVTALSFIALIMCLKNPYIVLNTSFQLSFGIVFCVIFIAYPVAIQIAKNDRRVWGLRHKMSGVDRYRFSYKKKLITYMYVSFLVQLTSVPIIAYIFYEIPLYSFFLNMLLLPVFPVLLISGLIGATLLSFGEPFLSRLLLFVCHFMIYKFEEISDFSTRLPFSRIVLGRLGVIQLVLFYGIIFSVFIKFYRFERRYRVLAIILSIIVLGFPKRRGFSINMLYVGQGDGIHISMGHDVDLFVDGGSTSEKELGKYTIMPYLKYHAIRDIDVWYVTHSDMDHISGLIELLEAGFPIGEIQTSAQIFEDKGFRKIEELAKKNKTRIRLVKSYDSMRIGKDSIEILAPDIDYHSEDINDYSLIFSLSHVKSNGKKYKALFTGDISGEVESELLDRFSEVDLLKACHHGSNNSNSYAFLKKISPRICIISAGENNRYHHPGKEALERLNKVCEKVICTIENGQISIRVK